MSRELDRLAELARSEPGPAWAALRRLPPPADAETLAACAAFAFEVAGLVLGRWGEIDAYAATLLAAPGGSGAEETRIGWRLRGIALLLDGDPIAAASAERRGIAGRADACRAAACTALALAAAGRTDDAMERLEQAAALAAGLVPADPAVALLEQTARRMIGRSIDLHRASHQLALAAGEALAAANAGRSWQERHRALAERAHALLDLGETRQPGLDLEELLRLEDAHTAGPGPRCWTTALHCRLQLALRGRGAAFLAWEACRDFAGRMAERDAALDRVLEHLRHELDPG